ncbi:MAG: FAD-binding protein [Treponema sp.]|jgi:succinate dehydrogenase / fumarate reductase flavoprotein subunit|nr:FAD-binding protein [Treponema sp.]
MGHISRVIESDVLVIGGAGAAAMSAVRASREGVSVVAVSKGKAGKSGNTIMIGGGFGVDGEGAREICGEAAANPEYTREKSFKKLAASGFYLGDQRLQKIYVDAGPPAVKECLDWAKAAGQLFCFNPAGCSWLTSGAAFGRTVAGGLAAQPGISVHEDVFIAELLSRDGQVCGALGIDIYSGEFVQYNAGAVILATGGYQPFSIKNSHSDMTGDGIALALRAGCRIVDMEFLLFIGTILEPLWARGSLIPFLFTIPGFFPLRARMTDLDGVELSFPPDPRYRVGPTSSKVNKLLMAEFYGRGIFEKIDTHGNAFYYDYSAYRDEEIRDAFRAFAGREKTWHREGFYNGIDLSRLAEDIIRNGKRMKAAFGNEYSMGGVVVEPDFSTGVPGLYAAGEVTGGAFGAFRSGDGLTEMLAHGYIAGVSAAAFAKSAKHHPVPADAEEKAGELLAPFSRPNGLSPAGARAELERICDEGFDFFREGKRLEKAYGEITELRKNLDGLSIPEKDRRYNLEWLNAVMARNLALCAESGIYGALNRKESRGTHLRADYPELNNRDFLFSFNAALKDGRLVYSRERPRAWYLPLCESNYPSTAEYLADQVLREV